MIYNVLFEKTLFSSTLNLFIIFLSLSSSCLSEKIVAKGQLGEPLNLASNHVDAEWFKFPSESLGSDVMKNEHYEIKLAEAGGKILTIFKPTLKDEGVTSYFTKKVNNGNILDTYDLYLYGNYMLFNALALATFIL